VFTAQQPAHDVASQAQTPSWQRWPLPQLPLVQTPPQSSVAPQALPAQLGVQPHAPLWPPPPQVRGEAHVFPGQQGCPLPPHVPQVLPQIVPFGQGAHMTPPAPHAPGSVPDAHVAPLQQPEHEVGLHAQVPATQR
jgi:hypothetical protein